MITVRQAGRADARELGTTLAAAFQDDPVMSWIVPDPRRRAAGLPHFFTAMARHVYTPFGACELATDPGAAGAGATLWGPPGHWHGTPAADLRTLPGILRAFGRRTMAGKQLGELLAENHPREPHWYLSMIGTTPEARGAGFGQALLRSRLDRVDAEGAAAYLESSNPDNIGYYERFGFAVTGELRVPGGPPLWPMWRPATA
ncbi:GNAT family N-acetyltransferase [Nocardia sp. NPDC004415]